MFVSLLYFEFSWPALAADLARVARRLKKNLQKPLVFQWFLKGFWVSQKGLGRVFGGSRASFGWLWGAPW